MVWKEKWRKVIFSDEKKFNLDWPNGSQFYWHDLRRTSEIAMSRNFGGGSVMIGSALAKLLYGLFQWDQIQKTAPISYEKS